MNKKRLVIENYAIAESYAIGDDNERNWYIYYSGPEYNGKLLAPDFMLKNDKWVIDIRIYHDK